VTGLSPFDSADKNNKELVAHKMKERSISCPSSHSACQEFYIFGESAIEYGRYEGYLSSLRTLLTLVCSLLWSG
jgi:hypothetical protein